MGNELEIGLDHANKANSEGLKSIKRYQSQLRDTIQAYEDEARARSQIMEQAGISERKAAALSGELEESKALLDSADRSKRQLEMEIADARTAVNNMQVINGREMTAKRGLEGAIHTIQAEVDAMLQAAKNAEEKAKKAMIDAARLADELRAEQENAQSCEKSRRTLENQVKDMQTKLDEAEQLAVKGGRKVTSRLEQKIKDLESQFDDEQRRLVEAEKSQRRTTRRIKELTFVQEEDQKNHERMQELVDKLQNKVKNYKKQIEEAEEIAALNLAKFRKIQSDLESVEERADINEQVLAKYKAKSRGASAGPN